MLVLVERLVVYKIVCVGSWGEWYIYVLLDVANTIYYMQPASV